MTREEFDKLKPSVITALGEWFELRDRDVIFEKIKGMSRYDILDTYLKWHGIMGFTTAIANICGIE